ncbi:MAG: type II secretion system protein GspD, partial [Planctomycetota bacterium]
IPYARDLTYPKKWREIDAKRKPDEAIGKDPATTAVYKQLDEVVDLSALNAEMPFGEAIDEFKNYVEPPLKIIVLWRDLYDNADIDQSTPINMDQISAIQLGKALELLLKSVSGGFADLGYVVDDGVITIATVESLPSEMINLVYDVTDLLGRKADFYAKSESSSSGSSGDDVGGEGFEDEDEMDRDELLEEAQERADELMLLIQETIEPDSWYEAGGEGTITVYGGKKLIVRQTNSVHSELEKLLAEMRKSLGHQVSIEARFLLVGENFLEDIGIDFDVTHLPFYEEKFIGSQLADGELVDLYEFEPTNNLIMDQSHINHTRQSDTQITGSLPSVAEAAGISLGFGGLILNNLQVDFLLRATQAHRDSRSLTAPKVSVLSGESASLRVQRRIIYPADVEPEVKEIGDSGASYLRLRFRKGSITTGTILNITPTITPDRKNVLLNITAELIDFLGWEPYVFDFGSTIDSITYLFPETEVSRIQTRVSVPDGGTLLLGGQKVTAETELESGVPILSKIPYLGRLFSNRSKIKDQKILLVLVQPTIILREEAEAEAIAAMK